MSPLCESFLAAEQLNRMEPFYPLHVWVCDRCFLVQLEAYVRPEDIFTDYAYFSSYSDSWLAHGRAYCDTVVSRFGLGSKHLVIEVASNDGYLLQHFVTRGSRVLGIEPAKNVAFVAQQKGIDTHIAFFGRPVATQLVAEGKQADLLIGNNVLAQVPDLNDFVAGLAIVLAPGGVLTLEFPHLLRLVEENQFDTIYHEHFSYFSFTTVVAILAAHGLTVFDVDEIPTHGGSLCVYAHRAEDKTHTLTPNVQRLLTREGDAGVTTLAYYASFTEQVKETKRKLLTFLIEAKRAGKSIVGYGAPGKGNTLLNYCGIREDMLDYTVDRSPHKQGKFLPGTHIPIYSPDTIAQTKPDYVLILPWNLKREIMEQMSYIREWGGRFVVPIPEVQLCEGILDR
jgi:SAM-dependent methyltransferase